jgi:hypothetical protein
MAGDGKSRPGVYAWAVLIATVALVVFFRLRLLDLPLERDEGEFALMGQMILDGKPPYGEAYNLKPPGIYLAYAGVMAVFGQSPSGIHAGLLVVNLLSALFLFFIVRILRGDETAALSTAAFVALSAMPKVLGLSAHATQFVILPALWGIWILLRRREGSPGVGSVLGGGPLAGGIAVAGRDAPPVSDVPPVGIGWAGFLMGVSFLVKQPGIFFLLLGAVMVMRPVGRGDHGRAGGRPWIDIVLYGFGALIPVFLCLVWLWSAGVFDRFWFWVVDYALKYGTQVGYVEAIDIAWSVGLSVAVPSLVVLAVAVAGARSVAGTRSIAGSSALTGTRANPRDAVRDVAAREERFFIFAFLAASALAVAMGFHFRRHYFVLLIPAVSILFGVGVGRIREWLSRSDAKPRFGESAAAKIAALAAAVAIAQTVVAGWPVYFAADADRASREMFGTNPFVESPLIGEKIRGMTAEGERVAVVGSEPQIYFYAHRPPATGYLYTYSLVEDQPYAATMRDEMIAEITRSRPRVIVYVNTPTSWLLRPKSDLSIFRWMEEYAVKEGYRVEGIVDVISPTQTVSLWGEDAARYTPRTRAFVRILKRAE